MRALPFALLGLAMLGGPSLAKADELVVDRGLPTANLNNAAGADRSNVAWANNPAPNFYGDTFTLPNVVGAVYTIDTIRTWVVVPDATTAAEVSAIFPTVTLFTGTGTTLSATSTAATITATSYTGGAQYQSLSGASRNIFQVDFTGLGIVAAAGSTIAFGVEGTGTGAFWYNSASNAALSGSPQDGADDVMQEYSWDDIALAPVFVAAFDSNGNGWDKSSDLNVQVLANVPEPASMALLGLGLTGLAAVRRRRG